MAEHSIPRLWAMRAGYLGFGLLVILFHLLPLELTPRLWAGPDLILAVTFAWALRRPEFVPALAIGGILLLADLLYQQPPGLLAALGVIGAESLKSRARALREQPFMVEWFNVSITILSVALLFRLVLAILLVPQAPLLLSLSQAVATVLVYPLVVFLSQTVFGVRKSTLGEVNALGQRL